MSPRDNPADLVLNALAGGACLTMDDLAGSLPLTRRQISNAAARLVGREWVERIEAGCFRITEAGAAAHAAGARVRSGPRGAFERRRPVRNSFNTRLWRAMRLKGKFTMPGLIELAARDEKNPASATQRYVRALEKAGFVLRLNRREPGTSPTSNGFARYSLVRDTGDRPPMIRRDGSVFDPNTGTLWRDGQEVPS